MTLTNSAILALVLLAISPLSYTESALDSSLSSKSGSVNNITIASIDWCPYICVGEDKPGVLTEYVKKIFAETSYTLSFTPMPWARAIQETQAGRYQALLAPAKEEAPGLVFPSRPLGYQVMCLFTRSEDPWEYEGLESLKGRRIVYGYGAYPASLEGAQKFATLYPMPYSKSFVRRGVKMVLKKRTDTLLFTVYSTQYYLNSVGLADRMRNAGCVQRQAVYLAFTPNEAAQETRQALITLLDKKIETLEKENTFENLLLDYGLKPH